MRVFAALFVPTDAGLAEVVTGRPDAGLRWVDPARLHCTVAFAGHVDADRRHALVDATAAVTARHGALRLELTGDVGRFGTRVAYAAILPTAALAALHADVMDAWDACGAQPERRALHPHVTLARAGRAPVTDATLASVHVRPATWEASAVHLVRSEPAGPRPPGWSVLSESRLGASPA